MSQKAATPIASLTDRLKRIRHVALDLDGTIYRGSTLFPFTNPFLDLLRRLGVSYSFLTNNSSKSIADYAARLRKMGVPAEPEQIYISTQATLEYLKTEHPSVRRLFLLGTDSMAEEARAAGYELTGDSATDEPDAVLVGFDLDLRFARLCRAAYWIKQGKLFVASHPDRVCPTDEPTVIVDCGAVCAALESATGRAPDAVPGKPDPRMLLGLCGRLGYQPEELAMVGDRIYTDIEMARRASAFGVLVLSGEATVADVAMQKCAPDLVVRDLEEFGQRLSAAKEDRAC
jgi:HAD superfamily hydrolase (TIGR01450 family)